MSIVLFQWLSIIFGSLVALWLMCITAKDCGVPVAFRNLFLATLLCITAYTYAKLLVG